MAKTAIQRLIGLNVKDVSGLQLFASFVKRKEVTTLNARVGALVEFMTWAGCVESFEWDGTALTMFQAHVESKGRAASTVRQKIYFLRAFLKAGEQDGIVGKCVYYSKRGPKPKTVKTEMATFTKRERDAQERKARRLAKEKAKQEAKKQAERAKKAAKVSAKKSAKSVLYRMFGLTDIFSPEQLKKAYRHVAGMYHPDVNRDKDAGECFMLCRETFDLLSNVVSRTKYDFFVRGKMKDPKIASLVSRANSFMKRGTLKDIAAR